MNVSHPSHPRPAQATRPERILARDLPTVAAGSPVCLEGWVHRRRELARVAFVILRDRSGLAQVVVRDEAVRATIQAVPEESPVEIVGLASHNQQAPGGVEVVDATIRPLADAPEPPVVELWRPRLETGLPTLLDHAATTWRHPTRSAVWELAAASTHGFRQALDADGFTEVHTPKLVGAATESGANVFTVDYFGRPAYLAQSPQFYKQALVGVFERVYEIGPVFRAEPHDTTRHLAEYVSLDVELGFIHDHHEVIACLRRTLAGMIEAISERADRALHRLGLALPEVPAAFPTLHFREALDLVGAPEDEPDLQPAHERQLGEWAAAEHGSDFVVIHGYPTDHRAFYSHPDPAEPHWSRSFDLLFRGLELVSGAQRLHRYDDYIAALTARGHDLAPYESYLDIFRRGLPPHGGFAIGLERWVSRLVGAANIREVTLFPRDLHRLAP